MKLLANTAVLFIFIATTTYCMQPEGTSFTEQAKEAEFRNKMHELCGKLHNFSIVKSYLAYIETIFGVKNSKTKHYWNLEKIPVLAAAKTAYILAKKQAKTSAKMHVRKIFLGEYLRDYESETTKLYSSRFDVATQHKMLIEQFDYKINAIPEETPYDWTLGKTLNEK